MSEPLRVAEVLTEAAKEVNAAQDVEGTLDAIVHAARLSVPGISHVGVSVAYRDGRIETRAGTDDLVWELDQLQYDLGEGPCLHAVVTEPVTLVNHLAHEQRWPRYVRMAVARGVRAQLGLRLFVDGDTLGGLNLYSTETDVIEPDVEQVAELFAVHASMALGHARLEDQLHQALETRKLVGQAIGLVMERYVLDEGRAFAFLSRVSQTSNTKLREVARQLVEEANQRAAADGCAAG